MEDQDTRIGQLSRTLSQLIEHPEEYPQEAALAGLPPIHVTTSGLYKWVQSLKVPPHGGKPAVVEPQTQTEGQGALFPFMSEELALDVDGRFPLMVASGTISRFLAARVHWIANLQAAAGPNHWTGPIWYKDGDAASFPYTAVDIRVVPSLFPSQRSATVTFSGGDAPQRTRALRYSTSGYHPIELEFDSTSDATPVMEVQTHGHPNRPASLPDEALSIQKVFSRAAFNVTTSPGTTIVPLAGAGSDGVWSDMEMHDAMQAYWSRFNTRSQWAFWTFFARMHEMGPTLGGIMFDDIGPNHRQGTAIFTGSFISQPPPGDLAPDAWAKRMIFWTACHEMGHGFNLAHSWQKSLGAPWIALSNEPEARSFMNYPFNVNGGQTAFFSSFDFRFSDAELLFLRHAPAQHVQPGNAEWFDHHGFQQANASPEPTFKLELRVNRAKPEFEFLEPVVLDLKLTNATVQPQIVQEKVLAMLDHMTIVIKKDDKPARTFHPFARYCWAPRNKVLTAGESVYESLFVSAGRNGWDISEPGYYTIQLALHLEHEDIVSNELRLRVTPPRNYDEAYIAQDYFSDDVGRILDFDGSRFMSKGIDTLHEASERLATRRVAVHSKIALGNALVRDFRMLEPPDGGKLKSAQEAGAGLHLAKADFAAGHKLLTSALTGAPQLSAETLSHIDYHYYCDRYSEALADRGMPGEAASVQRTLLSTLAQRKVKPQVLNEIKATEAAYKAAEK